MAAKLDGPIPGQSLTMEPGNQPWEQPPLYAKPEQAIAFYLEKLQDEEILDETLFILDRGFPLSVLVESMTTSGVMEGVHTVDISTLINPIIHEYILNLAQAADIDITEDEDFTAEEKDKEKNKRRLLILLEDFEPSEEDGDFSLEEGVVEEPIEEGEVADPLEEPTGFIKRRE